MADEVDSKNFPPDSKPWDYDAPFHRINYKLFDTAPTTLTGLAYPCGCRREADKPQWTMNPVNWPAARAMRAIPAWVPAPIEQIEHREVEGTLVRSFQTWTDVPMLAWHSYYDWNLHVLPSKGYEMVRSDGNNEPSQKELTEKHRFSADVSYTAVVKGRTMECEWDCGAFGNRPGPMFHSTWLWPMTGERVWVMGRSIYDCGHPKQLSESTPFDPAEDDPTSKMRSELHPCRALATARWEAESFPENGGAYVPAIKFMFFAARKGGYWDFDKLAESDFEFIVDLPKVAPPAVPFPISHTGKIPHNTIVLRPRLLKKIDFSPFDNSSSNVPADGKSAGTPPAVTATFLKAGVVDPIVELVTPFNPDAPQAKVKIPVTAVADSECYGVILSLGWHDPDGSQAVRVKKCTVTFEKVTTSDVNHDILSDEEWFLKLGVNGRWIFRDTPDDSVEPNSDIPINVAKSFYLAPEDYIRISAHGAEKNLVDNAFQWSTDDRTIKVNGQPVSFQGNIQGGSLDFHQKVFREFVWKQKSTFGEQNEPLGLLDPGPMKAEKDGEWPISEKAFYTKELGTTAELGVNPKIVDYTLHYRLKIEPQFSKT